MRKFEHIALFSVTAIFLVLMIGVLVGRNLRRDPIIISQGSNYDTEATGNTHNTQPSELGKLNINYASATELAMLPGIGLTYAERIVEYRNNNGPFLQISDLTKVAGIGQKRLEQISDYITVGG